MSVHHIIEQSQRIVIKIGSAIIVDAQTGQLRSQWLETLIEDIIQLTQKEKEIIIVSSGAIALGRCSLGIPDTTRPVNIPLEQKQAAAAIGQVILSQAYEHECQKRGYKTALILLTPRDTEERRAHLNARATINVLLEQKHIPIINENDSVSTEEIRFGDNDRLAARVGQMIEADLLIQLSTTNGLYTDNPDDNKDAEHIPLVQDLTEEMTAMAKDANAGISTGGMKSKLIAAQIATQAGISMIITKGLCDHPLAQLKEDSTRSTLFLAQKPHQKPRKRWIASHVKTYGTITIDDGAVTALHEGRSLLPIGIQSIVGDFEYGDPVEIQNMQRQKIAIGLAGYSASETLKISGHSSDQIANLLGYLRSECFVHRNDLVMTTE